MWWYAMLADLVVVIHFAYVSYVVVGLLLIIAGIVRRWQWIRNLWFRVSHLLLIAIVAGESIFGIWCPLTDWEFNLRIWAGQKPYQGTFISELMNKIFWIKLPESVYTTIYVSVALFVLSTFWLAPPRFRRKTPLGESGASPSLTQSCTQTSHPPRP